MPTTCPIPERIIGIELVLKLTFTGSVTEVVIPHIGWDGNDHWVMDVGAGTDRLTVGSDDFMNSSYKSPDVCPGIISMCEANTINVSIINCETPINTIRPECIW